MMDKERLLKWLANQQYKIEGDFHNGGFSPYPETIKAGGVISTALALQALMKYNEGGRYNDVIKRGIDFLLRSQIDATKYMPRFISWCYHQEDGGFPPIGDLELITEISSPEATAEAIKTLRKYVLLSEQPVIESIRARIRRAENHLLFDGYWCSPCKSPRDVHQHLSCLEVLKDIYGEFTHFKCIDLRTFYDTEMDQIIYLFEKQGYLPFKFSEKDKISITNSVLGLKLLSTWECARRDIRRYRENLKDIIAKEIKKNKYKLFTEHNPIELYPIYSKHYGDVYSECYSLLPSLVYLFGEESELVAKVAGEVVDDSVNVWRGRKEPSVKETARLLLSL